MPAKKFGVASGAKSWEDLCRVTGLGRDAVKAAILTGELPGSKIGSRYIVTADAFQSFCEGRWVPQPRRISPEPIQARPRFLHSMKREAS